MKSSHETGAVLPGSGSVSLCVTSVLPLWVETTAARRCVPPASSTATGVSPGSVPASER